MTDVVLSDENSTQKGKTGLIIGVVTALILGGGAFFITYSGIFPSSKGQSSGHEETSSPAGEGTAPDVVFVALDPLVISLGKFASARHLRFRAHLEVEPDAVSEVEHLMPRIMDVLNTYLRAVSENELEDPTAMIRLRAQMFRRVQAVVGRENVRDLLITEFILN